MDSVYIKPGVFLKIGPAKIAENCVFSSESIYSLFYEKASGVFGTLAFLAAGGIWYLVFRQSGMYRVRKGFLKMRYLLSRPLLLIEYVTNYTGISLGISESISLL